MTSQLHQASASLPEARRGLQRSDKEKIENSPCTARRITSRPSIRGGNIFPRRFLYSLFLLNHLKTNGHKMCNTLLFRLWLEPREDQLFVTVTPIHRKITIGVCYRLEIANNRTYRSSSNRIELNTEYKLSERTRAEERRRNRAPGFLRGLAPTGCAVDDLRARYTCVYVCGRYACLSAHFAYICCKLRVCVSIPKLNL